MAMKGNKCPYKQTNGSTKCLEAPKKAPAVPKSKVAKGGDLRSN